MSVPTVRELNCSKSLGEIANLDFSVPVDCFAMYMLVSRYAGQSCHSSPTCRKTCLCMDRIHLSLQEMMTLKPVNEVDAIIKFMLFLCQVSFGIIRCCLLLIYSRLFLSLYYFTSHVIWRNLMAPFSVLRNLVPVSVLMLYTILIAYVIHLVLFDKAFVLPLDCFGPRSERPTSPDADSLLSHSSQFNSTLDRYHLGNPFLPIN